MKGQPRDIALAERFGQIEMHRADCPVVRRMAEAGVPVATMFGIDPSRPLPTDMDWHTCMGEKPKG